MIWRNLQGRCYLAQSFIEKTAFTNAEICVNGSIRLLEAISMISAQGKYAFRVNMDLISMVYIAYTIIITERIR